MTNAMDSLKAADPMERIFAMGRIKRAIGNYEDQKADITGLDKRLLKGFYTADKWELANLSEQESLKFSAKIDRKRVKGLIMAYWKNKEIKHNDL